MNRISIWLLKKILACILIGLWLWIFLFQSDSKNTIWEKKTAVITGEKISSWVVLQKTTSTAPQYVLTTLYFVRKNRKAPEWYQGWRNFWNYEKLLPVKDTTSKIIRYQERDVHPIKSWKNRWPERLITSPRDAYYTADHYQSFIKIE